MLKNTRPEHHNLSYARFGNLKLCQLMIQFILENDSCEKNIIYLTDSNSMSSIILFKNNNSIFIN
jgi:hypothetical protein